MCDSPSFHSWGFFHQPYFQVHPQGFGHFFQRAQGQVGVETFEAADVGRPRGSVCDGKWQMADGKIIEAAANLERSDVMCARAKGAVERSAG